MVELDTYIYILKETHSNAKFSMMKNKNKNKNKLYIYIYIYIIRL
jgi:hypothetical protein